MSHKIELEKFLNGVGLESCNPMHAGVYLSTQTLQVVTENPHDKAWLGVRIKRFVSLRGNPTLQSYLEKCIEELKNSSVSRG